MHINLIIVAGGFQMPKMHEALMESPSLDYLVTEEPPTRNVLKYVKINVI